MAARHHETTLGKMPMKGLTVQVKEDGVWLVFEASSGKRAIVHVDVIAESAEDRRKAAAKPHLA